MFSLFRIAISVVSIFLAWTTGFFLFYLYVDHLHPPPLDEPVDGIVVLTGGQGRIQTGLNLLNQHLGKSLLISGVASRRTGILSPKQDFSRISFDYIARDTIGNARETIQWAKKNNYKTLLIVTSNYHIARSMMELYAACPAIKCIPYPVTPSKRGFHIIFQEYNKFIYAFFRLKILTYFL